MTVDPPVDEALHRFGTELAGRSDLVDLVLFGSQARGTAHRDSDVDVAVVLRGHGEPAMRTKFELADVAFDVLLETGVYIEPFVLTEAAWRNPDQHGNPDLVRRIAREGRALGVSA